MSRTFERSSGARVPVACASILALLESASLAFQPPDAGFAPDAASAHLHERAFYVPELVIPSENRYLFDELGYLPNAAAWDRFFARHGTDFHVYVDARSGAATNVMGPIPFLPGTGIRNEVTLQELSHRLGRPVAAITPAVVEALFRALAVESQEALGIDARQLGPARVERVANDLWQIYVPQRVDGIPVRHAYLAATVNHGNIVLMGTGSWEDVSIPLVPRLSPDDALNAGLSRLGGFYRQDLLWKEPELEIVPTATMEVMPPHRNQGGYGHRLVWAFGFQRLPDLSRWEVLVDAHTGDVLSLQDTNHYATERISGGIYPLTSTGICPSPETCGTMQPNYPMPFTNTGLAAPNNYTDSAGNFTYSSGTVTTTLNGRYVRLVDNCGSISLSGPGSLNLGGTNNQHDCTTPGFGGAGNTMASRSGMYELNKIIETARGWLPGNAWLNAQLTSNMNINLTCNAFWSTGAGTVNFYRSGGGCRNSGEIAAVFDHEWGHGMDDNDANGVLSNSSEGYADIAGILRLEASCVGFGFFNTTYTDPGCGLTADGTGRNQDEDQRFTGDGGHCDTDCSGVRDADWAKHVDNTPDTPQNHVCVRCNTGTGPCGRQTHCAAAPQRQAGWDLAARDLQAPPFSYSRNYAFLVANKIFYLGSGNITTWYTCTCPSTSGGCGSNGGYLQWLAGDDDNGNINDGTPHMTAIHAAFNRHNIACATPSPVNSGCAGAPSTAPTLTVTAGNNQASLSWNAVAGATRYWVFRGEGYGGCDFGKARIATVVGTTYTDNAVANGTQYCYSVIPAAASDSCFGPASNCACVTPSAAPPPVGDGATAGGSPARFVKSGGNVVATWDNATCLGGNAVVLWNTLGTFTGYAGSAACSAGTDGTETFAPSAGSVWFNILWVNGTTAGHPGYGTAGARTWPATGLCSLAADSSADGLCN